MTTKDIGLLVALPPDVKDWVDAQADDIGVNAEIWIRMLVYAARKRGLHLPSFPSVEGIRRVEAPRFEARALPSSAVAHHLEASHVGEIGDDPDAWRGAVDDDTGDGAMASEVDVDAIVNGQLAEIEAAGPIARMAPVEAFGPPQQAEIVYGGFGGVRSLHRPAPAYSVSNAPRHLRGILA